jgi:hypothetical protein
LKPNKWAIKSTLVDWLIYNYIYIVNIGTYILIY